MSAHPLGPPLHSRFRCPSAMTMIALRCVFSSRARIARASSDSGHASFPSSFAALAPSRSFFRTPKKSLARPVSCLLPASHSGLASGEVMYTAMDTELASLATLRSAAPSLAPMSRETTACDRRAMSSLGSPPNVSSGVFVLSSLRLREMDMRPSASRPGPRPLSSPSMFVAGYPVASLTMSSRSSRSDAAAAAAVSITSVSIASAASAIGAIIAASASSRLTSAVLLISVSGSMDDPETRSAKISFSIS